LLIPSGIAILLSLQAGDPYATSSVFIAVKIP